MKKSDLWEFSENFHTEIVSTADAYSLLKEHAFVEIMGEHLVEYGDIEDCICCHYQNRGLKVDGYCFDDDFNDLTLVVSHWKDAAVDISKASVPNSELDAVFRRCKSFAIKSMKGQLHNRIEIANESAELSNLIYDCRDELKNIKIILITNGIAKDRPADTETIDDIDFTGIIWDIERTFHFLKTGERESININFSRDYGGALPCVVHQDQERYSTYISFVSGSMLADMYANWGTKLLDMNVRVFLSVRGKVNRGIRDTIINEPDMFCAYNNGITVFAREIEILKMGSDGCAISKVSDFQIVNGGQTTASLYHARKKNRANLTNTFVQMKLTVINNPDEIDILVPKISEYSNTQNKIQMADLLANDPPHPELHAISISTPAPDPTGGSKQTYWFYEKSRGSYEETKNMTAHTAAQKRKYDSLRPKKQRFDKNKFGKVWNTYLMLPYIVSLGAQKNFVRFNSWLKEQKDEDWTAFFKKTVALILLWNHAETLVRRKKFEGYRHNIVTYTLAWLFKLTDSKIDLDKIWHKQDIGPPIQNAIDSICYTVNDHIRETEKNVTEWCKKEDCWKTLLQKNFKLPEDIKSEYISEGGEKIYDPNIAADAEAIKFCKSKEPENWFALAKWLKERSFLSGKARSQCFNMGRFLSQGRKPSAALSKPCMKAWNDAEARGWIAESHTIKSK